MLQKRAFKWIGAGSITLHFLATWLFTLLGWSHSWAYALAGVLWFPGDLALRYTGGSKTTVMATMFVNSVLWGTCFTILLVVILLARRRQQNGQ